MVEGMLQRTTTGDGATLKEWITLTGGDRAGAEEMIFQSKWKDATCSEPFF